MISPDSLIIRARTRTKPGLPERRQEERRPGCRPTPRLAGKKQGVNGGWKRQDQHKCIWSCDGDATLCFSLLSEQKRNTSLTYSNSLRELLQRKISTLEQQLHHSNAALGGEDHSHEDEKEHHHDSDEHHRSDEHESDHKEGGDGEEQAGHQVQSLQHHEEDGDHGNEAGGHGLVSHTGYRAPGKTGFHSAKLDTMLNQLHLAGTRTHTPTAAK